MFRNRSTGTWHLALGTPGLPSAAAEVEAELRARRINVSVSDAAYHRLGLESRGLGSVVRASVHYDNTEAETDLLVATVEELATPR